MKFVRFLMRVPSTAHFSPVFPMFLPFSHFHFFTNQKPNGRRHTLASEAAAVLAQTLPPEQARNSGARVGRKGEGVECL